MATRNPQQTRERLLQTAFQEIHAHGFQGMRVDEVLRKSGLQKGAFYHHFGSKAELGQAVLEEQIAPLIESLWLEPLDGIKDPVAEFPLFLDLLEQHLPKAMLEHGCPLNNLAQEMASQDENFRQRIDKMFNHWLDGLEVMFERAKHEGYVRENVKSRDVARFVLAVVEGCIGIIKVNHSLEQWAACRSQITDYLSTLRPNPA
jgi:TetR/AcrR family transcriptional regulator, transcriptional repressor for nem operon